jgi:hypothetical protein
MANKAPISKGEGRGRIMIEGRGEKGGGECYSCGGVVTMPLCVLAETRGRPCVMKNDPLTMQNNTNTTTEKKMTKNLKKFLNPRIDPYVS